MQIIDTHCHYNLEPLFSGLTDNFSQTKAEKFSGGNWLTHWQKTQQNGVIKSIVVGVDKQTSTTALKIAQTDPNLFASVGIHPENATFIADLDSELANLEKIAQLDPKKVVAFGEIGLDYYFYDKNEASFFELAEKQQRLFIAQLELAKKLRLPIIIHSRDKDLSEAVSKNNAYWQILEIVQKTDLNTPFVLHCSSGPLNFIRQALEIGAYIGFAGNSTYENAQHIREIAKITPKDRLLVETDAPYLPSHQHRGQICEPWMIGDTVEFLQQNLNIDPNQVVENSQKCFGI